MNVPQIRYSTSSSLISTSWAAIYRNLKQTSYLALGCRPDPEDPSMPDIHIAAGSTPAKAYEKLVVLTGRPWWIVMREGDVLEVPSAEWRALVQVTRQIRMVSDVLWRRAEPIWQGAAANPDRSRGLWLALTAAHVDEITATQY